MRYGAQPVIVSFHMYRCEGVDHAALICLDTNQDRFMKPVKGGNEGIVCCGPVHFSGKSPRFCVRMHVNHRFIAVLWCCV